ncbi:MAG: hypothetical protein IT353_19420 [Gemmatimonadaceae bacterium]|nr:hypothetical protein [Gemmatimonadaceae bacterium]
MIHIFHTFTIMRAALLPALSLLPAMLSAQVVSPPTVPPPSGPAQTVPALPGPAVRRIESAQAISTEPLGAITNVRHLSDGRVLLNDGTRRRLLMLDSTLKLVSVVLDSLTEVHNAYGTRAGTIIPYRGDSTMFIDPATLAMLVLDGSGAITRVRAVPRAQDISFITNANFQFGVPGFDAKGRLVHRINAVAAPPAVAPPPGMPYFPSPPDSAFIVAVDLGTRKLDTLGVVKIPRVVYSMRMEPEGYYNINMVPNPLPLTDDWGLLADGTIAFVRGQDYRIEYRAPDGTMSSSDKQPFPWVRLADDDKIRFADSAKTVQITNAQREFATQMIAWSNLLNKPYPASFTVPSGYTPPPGLPKDWILPKGVTFPANYVPACPPGVSPPAGMASMGMPGMAITDARAAAAGPPSSGAPSAGSSPNCMQSYYSEMFGSGYTPPPPIYRAPTLVRPADLPDYKPPVALTSAKADADGNLWVRTLPMRPTPGGIIFDVINRAGVMVDRIQLPPAYQLVGFGPGRIVYLSNRDATGLHLSRVRLK